MRRGTGELLEWREFSCGGVVRGPVLKFGVLNFLALPTTKPGG